MAQIIKPFGGRSARRWQNSRFRRILTEEEAADSVPYSEVVFNTAWDGTHTGQDATDASETPHTLTWGTSANLTNAAAPSWATTSLRGTGGIGWEVTAPASSDWAFGTDDFTVELNINTDAVNFNANQVPISTWTATDGWWFRINNGGASAKLEWGFANTVVYSEIVRSVLDANEWAHIAACRSGTDLRVFVKGTQLGATVTNSTDVQNTATLKAGTLGGQQGWSGYLADFRVTKGHARYTENFTPPTAAYPTS